MICLENARYFITDHFFSLGIYRIKIFLNSDIYPVSHNKKGSCYNIVNYFLNYENQKLASNPPCYFRYLLFSVISPNEKKPVVVPTVQLHFKQLTSLRARDTGKLSDLGQVHNYFANEVVECVTFLMRHNLHQVVI